jgi:dTDP-4-amino-4,6-dideoxygalactose transaminase
MEAGKFMEQSIPLVDLRAQYEPLKDEIKQAWDGVLGSMQLFLGPNVQAFEKEFGEYCGTEYAIGVSDGTSALHLALRACGVGAGDEVITVSHTFIATIEAIYYAGARPVFVDVDQKTYTMDVSQIEECITPKTRAILPVHLYGQCADMDPILEIAARHGLPVIEDACQAHGATYKGRKAGSMGTAAAFSFYYTKNLGAYGEGGAVTTADPEVAQRVRMMRDHGSEKRYEHERLGWNCRLDELQAAALRIKLRHLDAWNDMRRENARQYGEALEGIPVGTPQAAEYNEHVYHLYVVRAAKRDELREHLGQVGIGSGIHYPIPAHLQKACVESRSGPRGLGVTEGLVGEILSLPMYAELRAEQIQRVAAEIKRFSG